MNKNLIIYTIALVIGLISSCSEQTNKRNIVSIDNSTSIETVIKFEKSVQEIDILYLNEEVELVGEMGTKITLNPYSFVLDGKKLSDGDEIKISLVECYSPPDIVKNWLSTECENKVIETAGMIYLELESNGRQLKLREKEKYSVQFPKQSGKKEGMKLYYGEEGNTKLVWKGPISEEKEIKLPDTLYSETGNVVVHHNDLDYYLFDSYELGWLNCDREMMDDATLLEVKLDEDISKYQPSVVLVFNDINSVCFSVLEEGQMKFYGLPIGKSATIIGFTSYEGMEYIYTDQIVISKGLVIDAKFEASTLDEIQNYIESLQWGSDAPVPASL